MKLSVSSGNSTKTHALTNAAPAKPYLQVSNIIDGTVSYLPLYAANSSVAGLRMAVINGASTYRAKDYTTTSSKVTYSSSSVSPGNMSSTTALTKNTLTTTTPLTASTTTGISSITTKTTYTTSPLTTTTRNSATYTEYKKSTTGTTSITTTSLSTTTPLTKSTITKTSALTASTTTQTGTSTMYTKVSVATINGVTQSCTSFTVQLHRSSFTTNNSAATISKGQVNISFITNANQVFLAGQTRPFAYERAKITQNNIQLSFTKSQTSTASLCSSGIQVVQANGEEYMGTSGKVGNANTLVSNATRLATSSDKDRPWRTSNNSNAVYRILGNATVTKQGLIQAHSISTSYVASNSQKVYWFTDITYDEVLVGETKLTYGTKSTITSTATSSGSTTTGTSSHTRSSLVSTSALTKNVVTTQTIYATVTVTTSTSYHTKSTLSYTTALTGKTTTSTSSHYTVTTTGYSGVSSSSKSVNTWA